MSNANVSSSKTFCADFCCLLLRLRQGAVFHAIMAVILDTLHIGREFHGKVLHFFFAVSQFIGQTVGFFCLHNP